MSLLLLLVMALCALWLLTLTRKLALLHGEVRQLMTPSPRQGVEYAVAYRGRPR